MIKKLEVLTNVAILAVAVLAAATLVKNLRDTPVTPSLPPQVEVGSRFPLDSVDWHASRSTLVMALATTCHFCTDSAPFYRRLAMELPKKGVHVTAVLPQPQSEGTEYLSKLDVPVTDVRQGSFRDLRVRGAPTLILVDREGVVRQVWFGQLTPDREEQLIKIAIAG